jgi:hypothetical protein
VAGSWRRPYNEEHHNVYSSQSVIRVIKPRRTRWGLCVPHMGEMRSMYKILANKPEGKRSLRRPMSRHEDNIRMNLMEIGWKNMEWMHLAQYRDQWWTFANMIF